MSHLPKVSVFILTYNQVGYVEQMVESILVQRGDFDLELVIGDDASSDGTTEVLISFQERYPDRIILLRSTENMGLTKNFMRTLERCKGDYLAICDGDDYWTDPLKLKLPVPNLRTLSPEWPIFQIIWLSSAQHHVLANTCLVLIM